MRKEFETMLLQQGLQQSLLYYKQGVITWLKLTLLLFFSLSKNNNSLPTVNSNSSNACQNDGKLVKGKWNEM